MNELRKNQTADRPRDGGVSGSGWSGEMKTEPPTIRIDYLANHADGIPALAAVRYEHWRVIYEHRGISLEDLILRIRKHAQTEAMPLAVVALHGQSIVGCASVLPHDLDPRPDLTPWLGGVFVLPAYRGQGIATRLVERILSEARRLRLPHLYLWTTSSMALYARLGWARCEQMKYCGETIEIMHRAVD
jgi:N-acetylglutamate synthase-like GNAT family acetyltransferase